MTINLFFVAWGVAMAVIVGFTIYELIQTERELRRMRQEMRNREKWGG